MDGMAAVVENPVLKDLNKTLQAAIVALDTYSSAVQQKATVRLAPNGKPNRAALDDHQHLAHGLAWLVTYTETLRETANWAKRLEADGKLGDIEALLAQILFGRYLSDIVGGIAMNQGEVIRPHEFDAQDEALELSLIHI